MKKQLQSILKVKEKAEKELLFKPGVTGIDVGYKYVKGKRTKDIVIRIFVKKKIHPENLAFKKQERLPSEIDGVPTDIIQENFSLINTSYDRNVLPDSNYYPVLEGGIPINIKYGNVLNIGTGGVILKKKGNNEDAFLLTNYHVVAIGGGVTVNGSVFAADEHPRNQTGLIGKIAEEKVGEVEDVFIDAAIIKIEKNIKINNQILQAGKLKGISKKSEGQLIQQKGIVKKRGRTTKYTRGFIDGFSGVFTQLHYEGIGSLPVRNVLRIVPDPNYHGMFASSGDSGSVVLDANNNLVGLLFAASSEKGTALVSPIQPVLKHFDLEIPTAAFIKRWNKRVDGMSDPKKQFKYFKKFIDGLKLRHFMAKELWIKGDRDGNPQANAYGLNRIPPEELWENMIETIQILDEFRERINMPIRIISAYRSLEYNLATGGREKSQHIQFKAVDFIVLDPTHSIPKLAQELRKMRDVDKLFKGGIGVYNSYIHLDIREENADW